MSGLAESRGQASAGSVAGGLTVIEPWRRGVLARFLEIWRYRALIPYVGKEFVVKRYRQTYLGLIWIPLRPGIDLGSRALLFGGFLGVSSGDRPYFIFLAFATAGWMIFDSCLRRAVRAVRLTMSLAKGAFVPRSLGLIGCLFPAMLEFVLYAFVAVVGTAYYLVQGQNYLAPPQQMIFAVAGVALVALFALSLSLWIAPLAMITKEVRYVMAYVLQFWYFVTPVIYPLSSLPEKYRPIAEFNPLTAPIELIKYGLLSTAPPTTRSLASHFIGLTVILVGGLWFSTRFERVAVARLS